MIHYILAIFLSLSATIVFADITIPTVTKDDDGDNFIRIKHTKAGWAFQHKNYEFQTCVLNSVVNLNYQNQDIGDVVLRAYDAEGVQLTTQGQADTSCVRTEIDWEANHDFEIAGGMVSVISSPSDDLRLWVIAVPDIPEGSGGTKVFSNAFNLRYLSAQEVFKLDGRQVKRLNYNATYHTNKIRSLLRSTTTAFKHRVMMSFEIFKP